MKEKKNKKTEKEKPFNEVDFFIKYEGGELADDEVIDGFQHLIDSGIVWQLQGSYGRMAENLIDAGLCHISKKKIK